VYPRFQNNADARVVAKKKKHSNKAIMKNVNVLVNSCPESSDPNNRKEQNESTKHNPFVGITGGFRLGRGRLTRKRTVQEEEKSKKDALPVGDKSFNNGEAMISNMDLLCVDPKYGREMMEHYEANVKSILSDISSSFDDDDEDDDDDDSHFSYSDEEEDDHDEENEQIDNDASVDDGTSDSFLDEYDSYDSSSFVEHDASQSISNWSESSDSYEEEPWFNNRFLAPVEVIRDIE
jgi:hypothetical protein